MLERALKAVLKNGVLGVFTLAMLLVFTTGCSRKVYNANPSLIGESQIDDLQTDETPTRHIDAYGYLNLPPDSPLRNPYHDGHFQEMERDAAKLQLLDLLDPYILKRIIGVEDRKTGEIKMRDPIMNRTLDQKLQVNLEIVRRVS